MVWGEWVGDLRWGVTRGFVGINGRAQERAGFVANEAIRGG